MTGKGLWTGSEVSHASRGRPACATECGGASGPVVTREPVPGLFWWPLSVSADCCGGRMWAPAAAAPLTFGETGNSGFYVTVSAVSMLVTDLR